MRIGVAIEERNLIGFYALRYFVSSIRKVDT